MVGIFINDPSLYGAAVTDETLAGRIRAQQVSSLQGYIPYLLMDNLINAIILSLTFAGTAKQFVRHQMIWHTSGYLV